jgi:hypothetical protein
MSACKKQLDDGFSLNCILGSLTKICLGTGTRLYLATIMDTSHDVCTRSRSTLKLNLRVKLR